MLVAGEDCCTLCEQALSLVVTGGDTYVSSSPDRGNADMEAFTNFLVGNIGM